MRTEGRRAGRCTHVARARTRIASISHFRAGWDGDGGKGGGKGGGGEAEGEEDGDNGEGGEAQRVVNGRVVVVGGEAELGGDGDGGKG